MNGHRESFPTNMLQIPEKDGLEALVDQKINSYVVDVFSGSLGGSF